MFFDYLLSLVLTWHKTKFYPTFLIDETKEINSLIKKVVLIMHIKLKRFIFSKDKIFIYVIFCYCHSANHFKYFKYLKFSHFFPVDLSNS